MRLPYGVLEQYEFFSTFLHDSTSYLHIENPFYETAAILDIAIQDWETEHGSDNVRIQYFTSDSCIKRVLTRKWLSITKRILLDQVYISGWVWKKYSQISTSERPGYVSLDH